MLQYNLRDYEEAYGQKRRQQHQLFREKVRHHEELEFEDMEQLHRSNETRKFYKKLNGSRQGFTPRVEMCRDKDGVILTDEREVIDRWKQHFDEHLNGTEAEAGVQDGRREDYIGAAGEGVMRRAGFNMRGTIFSKSNQFICYADDMDIVGRTLKAVADTYTGLKREAEKCSIYKSLIRPVVLYGHETWTMLEEDLRALSVFERRVLRTIFGGVFGNDGWRRRMNHELAQLYNEPSIRKVAKAGRLQWAGHVARMPERPEQLSQRNQRINPAKLVFVSEPVGTRRRGVQRARWVDQVENDLERVGAPQNWRQAAMDRACWRRIVQQAKLMV
ncbi:uncharacterized protein LOC119769497 [Culex quinquefasciatus]|uniref:uncharacterized protein LOC119769497 n=1 Tax=Culex quinquefasciatus TaxID=7176 RepID=UPI0018E2B822|nr:uncharacterized protein LOC119769497 [Culex quinquefasciatus]